MHEATKAVAKIAGGSFEVSLPVRSDDELGELATGINHMAVSLKDDAQRIAALNQELANTQAEVIETMGLIGESRSGETGRHVFRVAEYSHLLALACGLSPAEADLLKQASPMHDIGKVGIPDRILNKNGPLTPEEFDEMKRHTLLGYGLFARSERQLLKVAATVAYEHHERFDGTGYPRGLQGQDIHLYGRITAVADVFDALGSARVYKPAWDDEKILTHFAEQRGRHFDATLIDLFFAHRADLFRIRDRLGDPA